MFHRTERLLLRPGFPEDAPELARAIADERIVRNLATAPWPYTEADAETFLAKWETPGLPSFIIARRTNARPQIIGACGVGPAPEGGIEIGYWIARPYWGLGFATEAARALVSIARSRRITGLHAGHFTDNPASGRVLQKAGFRATGRVEPRFSKARGGLADCVTYTLAEDGADAAVGGRAPGREDAEPAVAMAEYREHICLAAA